jgi:hypothetical protein
MWLRKADRSSLCGMQNIFLINGMANDPNASRLRSYGVNNRFHHPLFAAKVFDANPAEMFPHCYLCKRMFGSCIQIQGR